MNSLASRKPLDEAEVLSRFNGKMPLIRKLSGILADQTPRLLADIRRGIDEGDGSRVAHAAHTLKGSLAQLGAMAASDVARELEEAGEAGVFSRTEALVNQLQQDTAEVQRILDQLTQSPDV